MTYLTQLNPDNLHYLPAEEWQRRHFQAVEHPINLETPVISMIKGWLSYADVHKERYESGIGEDYVLGPQWAAIGNAIRTLLNGELGRLDAGTLDNLIYNTLTAEKFNPEEL